MFIRFVIHTLDRDSGRRQGLFQALSDIADGGRLAAHEQAAYEEVRDWFGKHLPVPPTFSRSRKPSAKKVALSWFKPSAAEHIARMRKMAAILEMHGIPVEILKQARPGYVIYEDQYQLIAEPYQDTVT